MQCSTTRVDGDCTGACLLDIPHEGSGDAVFAGFELFGAVGAVGLAISLPLIAFGLLLALIVATALVVTRVPRRRDAEHAV